MAAHGGLRSLFEKPLPENPTLLEALSSWNHIHPKKPVDPASFTEIFGELHFQERPRPPSPPPAPAAAAGPWLDVAALDGAREDAPSLDALLALPAKAAAVKKSASFCLRSSESLKLCTEGLGSESTVDADDMLKDGDAEGLASWKERMDTERRLLLRDDAAAAVAAAPAEAGAKNPRTAAQGAFPPPIPSIARGGKPCFCFRASREGGRFVLREVMIPGKEMLHASREDGRLKLHLLHPAAGATAGGSADEAEAAGEEEEEGSETEAAE